MVLLFPPLMSYIIWHNPRCTKSRQALQYLQEKGIEPEVRLYLEDNPSAEELRQVLDLLGKKPIELTRTKEKLFKELGLQKDGSDAGILQALVENPKLIERPIVIKDGKEAVIGRPTEEVERIL